MGLIKKKPAQPVRRRLYEKSGTDAESMRATDRYAFRRNRTLTGSLASHVESAGESTSELRSARVKTHDLHAHRKRLGSYLFFSLCFIAGLGWLIYQSIAVVYVYADTPQVIDKSMYDAKIQEYLGVNFWQRTRMTIDTNALAAYMQGHGCPEVASVSSNVAYEGFGASGFQLTFRRPVVVWKTGTTKLYVDDQGNAFSRNYYDDPSVEVVDETGIEAQNNQVLASERFLSMIGKVIGRMKDQGYTVNKVILPADTTHQLQISLKGLSYPIKISVDRSAGEQAEDAARAIKYLQSKGITPKYIDVRVSGKVFYK